VLVNSGLFPPRLACTWIFLFFFLFFLTGNGCTKIKHKSKKVVENIILFNYWFSHCASKWHSNGSPQNIKNCRMDRYQPFIDGGFQSWGLDQSLYVRRSCFPCFVWEDRNYFLKISFRNVLKYFFIIIFKKLFLILIHENNLKI
jgi:hypothetical protein